jgi:hypothetical protein
MKDKNILSVILSITITFGLILFVGCPTDTSDPKTYTVTWKNYDGTVLETDTNVPEGTTPNYDWETPTKPTDTDNTYAFLGWTPALAPVAADTVYTAQFTATPIVPQTYTVTWKNGDIVLKTDTDVAVGTIPQYNGTDPTKDADANYIYEFSGWEPAPAPLTADTVYIAQFTTTPVVEVKQRTIVISNIDADFNNKYFSMGLIKNDAVVTGGISQINNGSVNIVLKTMEGMNITDTNWIGTGTFFAWCVIYEDIERTSQLREGTINDIVINDSVTNIDGTEDILYQYSFPDYFNQFYVDIDSVTINHGTIPQGYNIEVSPFMDSQCQQNIPGHVEVDLPAPDGPMSFTIKTSAYYIPVTIYFGIVLSKRDDHTIITVKPTEQSLFLTAGPKEYTTRIDLGIVNIDCNLSE